MPDDHDRESREDWERDFGPDTHAEDADDREARRVAERVLEPGITREGGR